MEHNFIRKDNIYSFSVKGRDCKVKFEKTIELEIASNGGSVNIVHFNTIQEFIFFANKLIDILDDYTEEQRNKQ